jgi:hypothetical protein
MRESEKQLEIKKYTEACNRRIDELLKPIHKRCENAATIRLSRRIWNLELDKIKKRVLMTVPWGLRPYVIYQVNRYWKLDF